MKRISQFDYFFLISASLLLASGCGKQDTYVPAGFSTSAVLSATRDLTTAERTIATRICYAYQSKNTAFRTQTYYGNTFNFSVNYKDCSNAISKVIIPGVLTTSTADSAGLMFAADTALPFNKTVQLAKSGFLSQLCTKIQNNQAISNTVVDSGVTVQIAFVAQDMDSYVLQYFNSSKKIDSAETFRVRTQFNMTAGQILGMDESYTQQKVCSGNTEKFSDYSQSFVNFVAK
jgi:hypothetical protein